MGGHIMEMQGCGRKILHLLAFGALVVTLMTAFSLPAQARDKSSVLKASEVIGMNVQGIDGKKLGDIKDLVIDPEDGGVQYAVLDFGGFAGIGDKYFAVPWEALQLDKTNKKLSLDIHKKDLKDAPGFDKTNWPDLSLQQVVIYEFYEIPQPDREHAKR
jgi:sporulation protein YlmC with PRC-barrel domain